MLSETLKILKKQDIRLDKRKGQNYLVNKTVLSKIITNAELSSEDTVLEIGAGIGTLTIPLAKRVRHVFAVEQDSKVAEVLIERLEDLGVSNVNVIVGDATKMEFPEFNKVVSNLPYKISSPITFKLLKNKFDFAILMYQREFADRMVAKAGEKNYSRLSVMMHFCSKVEFLFEVSKDSFFPKPKVSSAVIKLTPKNAAESGVDEFFLKTVRALFQHKKKNVRNALLDSFHEIDDMDKKSAKKVVSNLKSDFLVDKVFKLEPNEIMAISKELKVVLNEFKA
ncbi:16S rRNA (adenine(1518)-N(6)/adenine(1519)-N(6))-dimethyltransferase RsmA [Methanobacterium paludis]|uniref:Probable ribosomal RNA small subunit methyltransferase A n=1 Tax=Methanobacterium paludis (strain DSM 25820 / JCM 18151 / SWAN1) TaxID=868131 RepID=F6D518_METPW|nr:16S rRNA (adenine(1518)-N(6)/adenine(1519)-N(6))-dimethyltransferase RsmA [Methanobacterium paludis]AEG19297.1 Ribosomal RNA small subunit methyltransferase A [Methanobacterium paludis]